MMRRGGEWRRMLAPAIAGWCCVTVSIMHMSPAQDNPGERGRQVFLASRCSTCHSVEAAGIPKKPKQKNPDLSAAGDSVDAAQWRKFLRREAARNGRLHLAPWNGTDADLDSLATWIGSLRSK